MDGFRQDLKFKRYDGDGDKGGWNMLMIDMKMMMNTNKMKTKRSQK